jgi:hypothetical protein
MPTGKPWPLNLVLDIASKAMEKDGWTLEKIRATRFSEAGKQKLLDKYMRRAKNGLHDCYVLGLIEIDLPKKED